MCWGDVSLQTDPIQDGREMLVWLNERDTKTRKGEENGHGALSRQKHPPPTQRGVLSNIISCSEATDLKK